MTVGKHHRCAEEISARIDGAQNQLMRRGMVVTLFAKGNGGAAVQRGERSRKTQSTVVLDMNHQVPVANPAPASRQADPNSAATGARWRGPYPAARLGQQLAGQTPVRMRSISKLRQKATP
ncbi:MAG: hypothetical protein JNM13_13720 [Hyphomicrobiaceae bacterium]|nr:hypothetical protein [Hyphomicrobiaceae bacterium]